MAPVPTSPQGEASLQDFTQRSPILFFFIVSLLGLTLFVGLAYAVSVLVGRLRSASYSGMMLGEEYTSTYTDLFSFDRRSRRMERQKFKVGPHSIAKDLV